MACPGCTKCRTLNKDIINNKYLVPLVNDMFDMLCKASYPPSLTSGPIIDNFERNIIFTISIKSDTQFTR